MTGNKLNTALNDIYYLQNGKAITFRKITNNTKYLHIFLLNFDKANYSFLHPFLLLGKTDFQKILLGVFIGEHGHE